MVVLGRLVIVAVGCCFSQLLVSLPSLVALAVVVGVVNPTYRHRFDLKFRSERNLAWKISVVGLCFCCSRKIGGGFQPSSTNSVVFGVFRSWPLFMLFSACS